MATERNVVPIQNAHELVQLAQSIQSARDFVKSQAVGKLEVIAEQMELLRAQAIEVLKRAQRDNDLHSIESNFRKVPGQVYFLYREENSSSDKDSFRRFLSLISPHEWGKRLDERHFEFIGAYRLELDQSWSKVEWNEDSSSNVEGSSVDQKKQRMREQLEQFLAQKRANTNDSLFALEL